MGKLRVREAEPSGKNESKVTQWQVVETELEPMRSRACALSPSALQPGVAWHFADPFGGKKTQRVGPASPRPRPSLWNGETEAPRLPGTPWKPPSQAQVSAGGCPRPSQAPARGGAWRAPTGSLGGREK